MAHIWDFVKTCFGKKKTEIIKRVIEFAAYARPRIFLRVILNQPLRHPIKITRGIKRSQLRWRNEIEWNSLVQLF